MIRSPLGQPGTGGTRWARRPEPGASSTTREAIHTPIGAPPTSNTPGQKRIPAEFRRGGARSRRSRHHATTQLPSRRRRRRRRPLRNLPRPSPSLRQSHRRRYHGGAGNAAKFGSECCDCHSSGRRCQGQPIPGDGSEGLVHRRSEPHEYSDQLSDRTENKLYQSIGEYDKVEQLNTGNVANVDGGASRSPQGGEL